MKKSIIILLGILCAFPSYAATVFLKSGKAVSGQIIEKTDQHIKVDLFNVPLTYFNDEIDHIEEDSAVSSLQAPSLTESASPLLTRENLEQAFRPRSQPQDADERGYMHQEVSGGTKCFLWKLQSGNATVYLLGSLHLLKKELFPLDKKIEQAFSESDTLVTEVDLTKKDLFMMNSSMMQEAVYQGNDTLKDHISGDTYERVKKRLSAMGPDINMFDKFKPWFVAIQMTATELIKLGFDPGFGIDKYFLDKAGEKKVLELETYDFQTKLLSSFSDTQQELLLRSAIMDLDTIEKEMENFIKAWLSGDGKKLDDLLFRNLREYPEMGPVFEKVFFQRNRTMVSKIEALIKNGGSYFIIVGAGHVVGTQGIIQLLQDKGFSLSQL